MGGEKNMKDEQRDKIIAHLTEVEARLGIDIPAIDILGAGSVIFNAYSVEQLKSN